MKYKIQYMKLSNVAFSIFLIPCSFYAQTETKEGASAEKAHLVQDYRIEKLNKSYEETYQLTGYRIQIYSGSKRQPAKQLREKFVANFKEINAHESYEQPFFKVRVGDFKTKLEAFKFQKEILKQFPDCYIVNDAIFIK